MTSPFDKMSERLTRNLARFSSRRGFLSKVGVALLAAPAFPLLPVARTAKAAEPKTDFESNSQATEVQLLEVLRL
jgi:methylamine dehydrogenase light chain